MVCQCSMAGFCETHKRNMSVARYNECKNKAGYFEMFENEKRRKEAAAKVGLGDIVEIILQTVGVKSLVEKITDNCGCSSRKDFLNRFRLWKKSKEA